MEGYRERARKGGRRRREGGREGENKRERERERLFCCVSCANRI